MKPSKVWLTPLLSLFGVFLACFMFFLWLDHSHWPAGLDLLTLLTTPDAEAAQDMLGSAAEVVAAVLGISITVVAIIVELAANRYTARVTDLFVRDRVNFMVCGLFVMATLQCLWTAASFREDFLPINQVRWTFVLMTASLLTLLPYFNYVFQFLQPSNIIARIRQQVQGSLARVGSESDPSRVEACKLEVMTAAEQITDIALNSIQQKDRGLAMGGALVLRGMLFDSLAAKQRLPEGWFELSEAQRRNSDYVTLSEQGLRDLERGRNWLEYKIFKQFSLIFAQALNNLRDLDNLIAMCFRDIGIAADESEDEGVRSLSLSFFNTAMRASLNSRDIRTAYNVLHQYRQFCSHLIARGSANRVFEVFNYFKYYGLSFEGRGMGFILETVAYDLYRLMREASDAGFENEEALLGVFLEVDRAPEVGSSDRHLRGVRKAQAMLAAYYLKKDLPKPAQRIAADMIVEPPKRLASIEAEILAAERVFWEVTDRGVNFDYLEDGLRGSLAAFFRETIPNARALNERANSDA